VCYDALIMLAVTAATTATSAARADKAATEQKRAARKQEAQFSTLMAQQKDMQEEEPEQAARGTAEAESLLNARRLLASSKGGMVGTSPLGTQWVPTPRKTLLGA
jgi:hypothetical protein